MRELKNKDHTKKKFKANLEHFLSEMGEKLNSLYGFLVSKKEIRVIKGINLKAKVPKKYIAPVEPELITQKPKLKTELKASVKRKFQKIKEGSKSTSGKIALVQSLVLIIIFSYLGLNHSAATSNSPRNIGQTSTDTLRAFLPKPGNYQKPQPFEEAAFFNQETEEKYHQWLTPWNIDQFSTQTANYSSYSAFWLTLGTDGFSVEPKASWAPWQNFYQALQNNKSRPPVYLTISGDPENVILALNDPFIQQKQISALLGVVNEQNFDGIDIDYEGLGSSNQDNFNTFVKNLTTSFHAAQKKVAVTVEARIANQVPMNWSDLGANADQVRIMAYDYHSSQTNLPGPISPIGWMKDILDYATQTIPADKLIIGIGNYGYDWTLTDTATNDWEGVGISYSQAISTAKANGATIERQTGIDDRGYDIGSTAMYNYTDSQQKQHSVWFEDNLSLKTKIALIKNYKNAGVIFWSVGLGDQTFWQSITPNN